MTITITPCPTLNNGRVPLAVKPTNSGEYIVLVHLADNDYTPYVTWRCNMAGDTYLGHYCRSYEEALADWSSR